MSDIAVATLSIISKVPWSKVISYGQVAYYIGKPKESREVGWAMRELGKTHTVSWWRVINNAGEISISGNPDATATMQKSLLEKEGIIINDFTLDIDKYRFRLDASALEQLGYDRKYIEMVIKKFEEPRQTSLFTL